MKLRFTIRDLLWLAAVVALAVGWWLQTRTLNRQLEAAAIETKRLQAEAAKHPLDIIQEAREQAFRQLTQPVPATH